MSMDQQSFGRGLGLAIGLAALVLAGCGGKADSKAESEDQLPTVSVIYPTASSAQGTVEVTGILGARNEIPVGPEGESGRIAAVLVDVGQHVRRGQELARLDPTVVGSQVAAMAASLDELRAAAAVAQAENTRAQKAHDAFSVEESERRRTTSVTAEARVKVAEAQLAEARTRWTHTRVLAPADGLVLTRNAEVGQIVMPGSSVLFRIAQGSDIELRAQVAEQDVPRLAVGQEVELSVNGVSRTYKGKVWQIGAIIDATSRQGSVRIQLADRDVNLRPGAFTRAEVHVAQVPGLVVPQTAVLSDDDGNYALIVGADRKLIRRAVSVRGAHPEGLLIDKGIEAGDQVVSTAGAFLRAGEKVRLAGSPTTAVAGGGARGTAAR